MAFEKELRKQRIFHMEYNPEFKTKDSRFFQKKVLGLPNKLINADDVAAGEEVYDSRYMKRPNKPLAMTMTTR